jgi:methylphosphotriester-DNA--protein-cysteine methyltransferase
MKFFVQLILLLLISASIKSQTYYCTPYGKKYHTATCHTVRNVSTKITLAEAAKRGLGPCLVCKPEAPSNQPSKAAQGTAAQSVQCKGITKSGARCRRNTRIANGYCFQHTNQ